MKLRLHSAAFDAALGSASRTRMVEGARLLLVEGWTSSRAAAHLGISPQSINRAADRIRAKAQASEVCTGCGRVKESC